MTESASVDQDHRDAFHAGNRSFAAIAPVLLIFVAIIGATRVPALENVLQLRTEHAILATTAMFVVMLSATAAYRFAGARSKAFRVVEQLETVIIQFSTVGLALATGGIGGRSFFWICFFVHAMIAGFSGEAPRAIRAVATLAPLSAALGFILLRDDLEAAVIAVANAAIGFFIVFAGQLANRRVVELSEERDRLRREVLALQVAQERSRIARDLHDGVAAELTALSARLDSIELEEEDPSQRELIDNLKRRARGSIDELRAVVWRLRAPERTYAELTSYAESTARALCPQGVALRFEVTPEDDDTRIPGRVGLHILRILLELVRNAVRHGAPRNISVAVSLASSLMLRVSDDGTGIGAEALSAISERSVGGLANIRARVAELGGSVRIENSPEGFSVTVEMPRPEMPAAG